MNVGTGMRKQGLNDKVDPALVARGLRDALSGSKTAMTEDEMKTTIQAFATEFRAAQEVKAKEASAETAVRTLAPGSRSAARVEREARHRSLREN